MLLLIICCWIAWRRWVVVVEGLAPRKEPGLGNRSSQRAGFGKSFLAKSRGAELAIAAGQGALGIALRKESGRCTTTPLFLQSALWHRCPGMLGTATLLLCTDACLHPAW